MLFLLNTRLFALFDNHCTFAGFTGSCLFIFLFIAISSAFHHGRFCLPLQLKWLNRAFVFVYVFYLSSFSCSTTHIEQLLSLEPFTHTVSSCALLRLTWARERLILGDLDKSVFLFFRVFFFPLLVKVQLQWRLSALITINPWQLICIYSFNILATF